jgi:hypothetical protein
MRSAWPRMNKALQATSCTFSEVAPREAWTITVAKTGIPHCANTLSKAGHARSCAGHVDAPADKKIYDKKTLYIILLWHTWQFHFRSKEALLLPISDHLAPFTQYPVSRQAPSRAPNCPGQTWTVHPASFRGRQRRGSENLRHLDHDPWPAATTMTVSGLPKISTGRVRSSTQLLSMRNNQLTNNAEWGRRLHLAVQEVELPLLRLGRKFQGHEVSLLPWAQLLCLSWRCAYTCPPAPSSRPSSRSLRPRIPRSRSSSPPDQGNTPSLSASISTDARGTFV